MSAKQCSLDPVPTWLVKQCADNIYIQGPVNSRVVEFYIMLTSVTNLHDYFGLYSLSGSMSVSVSMFTLTAQ